MGIFTGIVLGIHAPTVPCATAVCLKFGLGLCLQGFAKSIWGVCLFKDCKRSLRACCAPVDTNNYQNCGLMFVAFSSNGVAHEDPHKMLANV